MIDHKCWSAWFSHALSCDSPIPVSWKRQPFLSRSPTMNRIHMPRLAAALLLTSLGLGTPPAQAQDTTLQDAQKQAVEGIGKLLEALRMFVKSVPQYSAPEVLPNGDIILRRVNPEKAPLPEKPMTNEVGSSST